MTQRQFLLAKRWSERVRRAVYIVERHGTVIVRMQAKRGDELIAIVCGQDVVL